MILAVVGPTGVGKTKLSLMLARKYKAIIINCDAMQVYKGLNIGTAKIKKCEMEGIKHYLLDFKDVMDNYTVFDYQKDARKILEENKDKNIIFVGGSGLYLKAVLYNYVFLEEETNEDFSDKTNEELYELALKKDKNMQIHSNNRKRLIRFLNKKNTNLDECYKLYDATIIGLTTSRDILYERINNRVDEMFNLGLVKEVETLYEKARDAKSFKTAIGYKEFIAYFNNEQTLEEVKDQIKKNSRHYAKRQYTWLNHQMDVNWFEVNFQDFEKTYESVVNFIEKQ